MVRDEWVGLSKKPTAEKTLHEWSAASEWAGLNPPVSFETKQNLFYDPGRTLRDWTDEVWSDDQIQRKFEIWKEIRDAEHRNDTILKRDPKRVVNPTELDLATALYHFVAGDFKEQVLEEYARPYEPACRGERNPALLSPVIFCLQTAKKAQ